MTLDRKTYYLGADLGSSFTKFVVVDDAGDMHFQRTIPTLSRNRELQSLTLAEIHERFPVAATCATGYGRQKFECDLRKTELICASAGVSHLHPVEKSIIDIGGEDIKIIESGPGGEVRHFYMNDKCSAGTGAFITEIAERAELEIGEMSELARASQSSRVINSFCTVFAKTEILGWKFDNVSIEDISRGIYLSIVKRIIKLPLRSDLPVFLCGGVIAFHPYLHDLLAGELRAEVQVVAHPQYAVALGAALLAHRSVGKSVAKN